MRRGSCGPQAPRTRPATFLRRMGRRPVPGGGAASLHPLSLVTTTLSYGHVEADRQVVVRATYDHRALDASAKEIVDLARDMISKAPLARIDYVDLVDAESLQRIDSARPNSVLALAVFFGKTRLIDNIRLP